MKSTTKRIVTGGLAAAYAFTLFAGMPHVLTSANAADANTGTKAFTYFYDNLTATDPNGNEVEYTLAKKFYDVFDELNRSGDLKDGIVDYTLDKVLTSSQIQNYVLNGDATVPKAFGAARDAFLTDHPEIFYIDFYKLTVSAARSNGKYTAFIDSGREANAYHDGGFASESAVNAAIAEFNAEVNRIADAAVKYANADTYGTDKQVLQARYVNETLAKTVEYDYGSYDDFIENGTASAASVSTAYGALIHKTAVCGGFASAYKTIMDRLEIPCIIVNGFGLSQDESGNISQRTVMHAWNYIRLNDPAEEGAKSIAAREANAQWYAVDVTWNNTGNRFNPTSGANYNKYMNMGSLSATKDHITDGEISSSGYKLKYPELAPFNYGCNTNSEGLSHTSKYEPASDAVDQNGNEIMQKHETFSYNGKSAVRLMEEDNLYLAIRFADLDVNNNLKWTVWIAVGAFYKHYGYADLFDDGHQTQYITNTSILYTQLAVIDVKPDLNYNPDFSDSQPTPGVPNYCYDYDNQPGDHISALSGIFENEAYGTYVPAPYVRSANISYQSEQTIDDGMRDMSITDRVVMDEKHAQVYEITYEEPLHVLDESKPIGIFFTSKHKNAQEYAKLLPVSGNTLVELVDDYTLRFKFMPSLMYEHNGELYTFTFTNVGSAKERIRPKRDENGQIIHDENGNVVTETYTSDKIPNTVSYAFSRVTYACPKYFGYDGRLYVQCCAQPTLVDNSDLSAMDFKDEDGNSTFSEQERSQMMLVVNSVDPQTKDTMLDDISEHEGININKEDIKTSETYDIKLQMCNKYPTIPDKSYVKIALGFPEGYGPDDEGVTFKLFHRKHIKDDEYIIEEIPCVVTKFGIVATVNSFSPYMVAVVDADKASDSKTVYASIEGKGGKLTLEDGKILSLKAGESHSYTIQPDAGYQIYSVTLNGTNVTERVKDGKLNVTFEELKANNEIEIKYISNAAAQRYADKGVEIVDPVKIVLPVNDGFFTDAVTKSNTMLIVGLSIMAAVVVAAGITVAIVLMKVKNNKKKA